MSNLSDVTYDIIIDGEDDFYPKMVSVISTDAEKALLEVINDHPKARSFRVGQFLNQVHYVRNFPIT